MNSPPYIAVSAFETEEQVRAVARGLSQQEWPHPQGHVPLIGFAVDGGTLEGQNPPSPRKVRDMDTFNRLIAAVPPEAMASLHFDMATSGRDPRQALYDLMERLERPERLHSVQLNGAQANDLEAVRDQLWTPALGLIAPLQRAVVEAGMASKFLEACQGVAAHVLVDLSGGRGEEVSREVLERYLPQIAALKPFVGLGVAGGLSSENVGRIVVMARTFTGYPLSVDAESSVRIEDSLDPQAALRFYAEAYEALKLS